MIGQHAPRLEAGRRPEVHHTVWLAMLGVLALALVAAAGILVGLNLWGSGIDAPTGEEVRQMLIEMRQTVGSGGFI